MNLPQPLIDEVRRQTCVAFIGSGFSIDAGLPNWVDLLEGMLKWGADKGLIDYENQEALRKAIKDGKPLSAAEYMIDLLGNEFQVFMREIFRNIELKPTNNHNLLSQIPFRAVLTTNYDVLIESAYTKPVIPIIWSYSDIPAAMAERGFYILKLHGTIDKQEAEPLILGWKKYVQRQYSPDYREYLKQIFSNNSVLFIGYSLNDPDLQSVLDELKNIYKIKIRNHYALILKNEISKIDKKELKDRYDIDIIEFEKYSDIETKLRELAESAKSKIAPALPLTDLQIFERYLTGLISQCALKTIYVKGIPITPPIGKIFVYMDVIHDSPNVDQRIQQEFFEEIEMREKVINDPQDRERLYETYARDTRILEESRLLPRPHRIKISDVYQLNQKIVILGDPGTGKTTFLYHLTRKFCEAILKDIGKFLNEKVAGKDLWDEEVSLGPIRLPILLHVSAYSEARKTNPELSIIDYLSSYFNQFSIASKTELARILQRFIDEGRCLILLDGLDEIVDYADRRAISSQIDSFTQIYGNNRSNIFIVTSRIAGYRFAPLTDEFVTYTIVSLLEEQKQKLLKNWYLYIEGKLSTLSGTNPDVLALLKLERITQELRNNSAAQQMAESPLLLHLLVIIHYRYSKLPSSRAQLYEEATSVMLEDQYSERGIPKQAIISISGIKQYLKPIAMFIHENRASAHIERSTLLGLLEKIAAKERGEEYPSEVTKVWVNKFLEEIRQYGGGLFIERGEGLYGFKHLTFQEYFVALQIISNPIEAKTYYIEKHLHQPRWREPLILAISLLSGKFDELRLDLLNSIKRANTLYESVLHRDLLFVAKCLGDGLYVQIAFAQGVVRELLEIYCDKQGKGRYIVLRQQISDALLMIYANQEKEVQADIDKTLSEIITTTSNAQTLEALLEIVDRLKPSSEVVVDALNSCNKFELQPRAWALINSIHTKSGSPNELAGWDIYKDNKEFARLMGVIWAYGWGERLIATINISHEGMTRLTKWSSIASMFKLLSLSQAVHQKILLQSPTLDRSELTKFLVLTADAAQLAPPGSNIEYAMAMLNRKINSHLKDNTTKIEVLPEDVIFFDHAIEEIYFSLKEHSPEQCLENIGLEIIDGIMSKGTIAPLFFEFTDQISSFTSWFDYDVLNEKIDDIQLQLMQRAFKVLQTPNTQQRYYDTALLLVYTCDYEYGIQAIARVKEDVKKIDSEIHYWALQVLFNWSQHLDSPDLINFSENEYQHLIYLLNNTSKSINLVIQLVFSLPLSPQLLNWCWEILKQSDHPLRETLQSHLRAIPVVEGSRIFLSILNEGLKYEGLKDIAFELLRKVNWQGFDTFIYVMHWLILGSDEVRHLAALILVDDPSDKVEISVKRLLEVPIHVLQAVVLEKKFSNPILTLESSNEWLSEFLTLLPSHPLMEWLDHTLLQFDIDHNSKEKQFVKLLTDQDNSIVQAGVLALTFYCDLHSLVLFALTEAALSDDDRIRLIARDRLPYFVRRLPTDGSTASVQELCRLEYKSRKDGNGYVNTLFVSLTALIRYFDIYWPAHWLTLIENNEVDDKDFPQYALGLITRISEETLDFLCSYAIDVKKPFESRYAAISSLVSISIQSKKIQNNQLIKTFYQLLVDPEPKARRSSAHILQWVTEGDIINTLELLMYSFKLDTDINTRVFALHSMGRLLYSLKITTDHLELLNRLIDEIEQIFDTEYLASNAYLFRGSACALARLYHGDKERINYLRYQLDDNNAEILQAIIDSNSDYDYLFEGNKLNEYYQWEINDIAFWIRKKLDSSERKRIITTILRLLDNEINAVKSPKILGIEEINPYEGWPVRRILIVILAHLSEFLTSTSFTESFTINQVISIITQVANDPESFSARRYAIQILAELQHLNADIVDSLIRGFRDIDIVYVEAYKSIPKFKYKFSSDTLDALVTATNNESGIVASGATLLLGALGIYRFQELGNKGREDVTQKLYLMLQNSSSNRIIYGAGEDNRIKIFGNLYDFLFEALLQVINGEGLGEQNSYAASNDLLNFIADELQKVISSSLMDPVSLRTQAIRMQEELAIEQVTVTEGGIQVTISGDQKILYITIADQPFDKPIIALNKAIKASQELAAKKLQEIGGITKDLNLMKLREYAEDLRQELILEEIIIQDSDVKVIISGTQRIKLLEVNKQNNEDTIIAINRAIKQSQDLAAKKLNQLSGRSTDIKI